MSPRVSRAKLHLTCDPNEEQRCRKTMDVWMKYNFPLPVCTFFTCLDKSRMAAKALKLSAFEQFQSNQLHSSHLLAKMFAPYVSTHESAIKHNTVLIIEQRAGQQGVLALFHQDEVKDCAILQTEVKHLYKSVCEC